jgi:hypothetical protein
MILEVQVAVEGVADSLGIDILLLLFCFLCEEDESNPKPWGEHTYSGHNGKVGYIEWSDIYVPIILLD